MYYNVFILWPLWAYALLFSTQMEQARQDFHQIETLEDVDQFLQHYSQSKCESVEPYLAACIMKQAEYVWQPHRKLTFFKEGKNRLEKFIQQYPDNLEARYLRIIIQLTIPRILGYSSDWESDYAYLRQSIDDSDLPVTYRALILKNIENIKSKP